MKTIIAGSRNITDSQHLLDAIKEVDWDISLVVSGTANGVDKLGEYWAIENCIPIKRFFPDWEKYKKSAGYIRNEEMARYADACLALWDGKSKGTGHMIDLAIKYNLKTFIWRTNNEVKQRNLESLEQL